MATATKKQATEEIQNEENIDEPPTEENVPENDGSYLAISQEVATQLVKDVATGIKSALGSVRKGESGIRTIQNGICDLLLACRIDGYYCFSVEKQRKANGAFSELENQVYSAVFPEIADNVKDAGQRQLDQAEDRKRVESAVKQMVGNGRVLEAVVTEWAIGQLPEERQAELAKPGALKWVARPTGAPNMLMDPPADLTVIVKEQCERDGLTLWKTYGGTRKGGPTGSKKSKGTVKTINTDLSHIIEALGAGDGYTVAAAGEQIARLSAAVLARGIRIVRGIDEGGWGTQSDAAIWLDRAANTCDLTARLALGKTNDAELAEHLTALADAGITVRVDKAPPVEDGVDTGAEEQDDTEEENAEELATA